jgi:hypothetical protein
MSAIRHRTIRRALRLLAVPAAALGLICSSASSASAAVSSNEFKLLAFSTSHVCARLEVHVYLNQYDTWGYLNNGAHARAELWADDPVWDNRTFSSRWSYLNQPIDNVTINGDSQGIVMFFTKCGDRSYFDEDWENDDEFYAKFWIVDGDGHQMAAGTSRVAVIGYIYG